MNCKVSRTSTKFDVITSKTPIGGSGRKPKAPVPMCKKTETDPYLTPVKPQVGLESVKVPLNSGDCKWVASSSQQDFGQDNWVRQVRFNFIHTLKSSTHKFWSVKSQSFTQKWWRSYVISLSLRILLPSPTHTVKVRQTEVSHLLRRVSIKSQLRPG